MNPIGYIFFSVSQPPRLDTIENIMKMSQMVTQALDEKSSPLQMLPHITSDMLRHFTTRKVSFTLLHSLCIILLATS